MHSGQILEQSVANRYTGATAIILDAYEQDARSAVSGQIVREGTHATTDLRSVTCRTLAFYAIGLEVLAQ